MSARGARSRKVQQKDVQKKEKQVGKTRAFETISESHDGFIDGRATPSVNQIRNGLTRSMTASSSTTSRSSSTHGSNSRPKLNTNYSNESRPRTVSDNGSIAVSDNSSKGREKSKFQAKGKETKAPRGRGGGVPIKTAAPALSPTFRPESAASCLPADKKTWMDFKVWEGGKDSMRPYGGFQFDEDMHSGSVLIYFKEEQMDGDRPLPSIRADYEVLRSSGSMWLENALAMGRIDSSEEDWSFASSRASSMSPRGYNHDSQQFGRKRMLGPTSPNRRSPPPFDIDQSYDAISSRATSRLDQYSDVDRWHRSNSPLPVLESSQWAATHEIWFSAPGDIKTAQGQRLHHVAIRNYLALLHGKSIVGADMFDMLSTLQGQIEVMYDFDGGSQSRMTPRERSVQMITNYLSHHGLDDVRNSIKRAMCLLAWSEQENVKWRQGYLEYFVHLTGVMIPELEQVPEFKRLSVVTRRNLGISAKTLQLRAMEAEEKLSTFDFSDLWGDTSKIADRPAYQSYQSFRTFLVNHYTRKHTSWPPSTTKAWLNRKLTLSLQEDFGSLYDYLVNRSVIWNPREERATRKWEMAHRKDDRFKADLPDMDITGMLVAFDAKFGYAHIPHPYPLVPRDVKVEAREKEKRGLFGGLKKREEKREEKRDVKKELQLSIVFSDATNIDKLDVNFSGSTLIDKFEQFEMTTDLKNCTPREARLGRWVLLYGILQVLSTLSVDVQALKHTEGVRYFLCSDLKRLPEWVTGGQVEHLEASQQHSWCWQRAWDPAPAQIAPVELEAVTRNRSERRHQSRNDEDIRHAPIGERHLSPTPSHHLNLDGATLTQLDIRHINEKMNHFSLSNTASRNYSPSPKNYHSPESLTPGQLYPLKPRLDSLPQTTSHYHHRPSPDATYRLTESDFATRHLPALPSSRAHTSMNTDLAGYPFSAEEVRWPVPPGYAEGNRRESGVGYGAGKWDGRERSAVGERGEHDRRNWV